MTKTEALRQELLRRAYAFLGDAERALIDTGTHKILFRQKTRRGDLYVDIWSYQTQVRTAVLWLTPEDRRFQPHIAERFVLPELKRRQVLDDLADIR